MQNHEVPSQPITLPCALSAYAPLSHILNQDSSTRKKKEKKNKDLVSVSSLVYKEKEKTS
jgi:hypothetical protein